MIKKPNKYIMNLVKLGVIDKVSIDYRQTGTDTAELKQSEDNGTIYR